MIISVVSKEKFMEALLNDRLANWDYDMAEAIYNHYSCLPSRNGSEYPEDFVFDEMTPCEVRRDWRKFTELEARTLFSIDSGTRTSEGIRSYASVERVYVINWGRTECMGDPIYLVKMDHVPFRG
jgi:hypothetical protein